MSDRKIGSDPFSSVATPEDQQADQPTESALRDALQEGERLRAAAEALVDHSNVATHVRFI
jgi:hypothetical protein